MQFATMKDAWGKLFKWEVLSCTIPSSVSFPYLENTTQNSQSAIIT